ncbi:MAG: HEPN domain-containing protein [Archaeoglobi archaeon]|nr:HEPN domain-containing protein [Candidatus Mnemosynella bozhongmuii]
MRRQLELADEFLSDAIELLSTGRLRSAIDRAYYAIFHAAQALLSAKRNQGKNSCWCYKDVWKGNC